MATTKTTTARAKVTPLHLEVLRAIHQDHTVTACAISAHLEVHTYTVHEAVGSLWVDGLLSVDAGLSRGHYLTEAGAAAIGVAFVPRVAATAARPVAGGQLGLFGGAL